MVPSGSVELDPLNDTTRGERPDDGVALTTADGCWLETNAPFPPGYRSVDSEIEWAVPSFHDRVTSIFLTSVESTKLTTVFTVYDVVPVVTGVVVLPMVSESNDAARADSSAALASSVYDERERTDW